MNSSLITADAATHLKIVVVALLVAILMVWIGITARITSGRMSSVGPRFETPIAKASVPARPPSSGKAVSA